MVTLFLGGDVMLGRGVDQVLPHPGDPALEERWVRDARAYVDMAEAANGPIPRPVGFDWPWGVALRVLDDAAPDVRVINLETAVTGGGDFAPGKAVHYRMNPPNLPCLSAVRPDVCALANNHVLDFGADGLTETLDALAGAGLRVAGAGRDAVRAARPAAVPLTGGGRVLVFSFGMPSSGIPPEWAAAGRSAGVALVGEPSAAAATAVAGRIRQVRRPGDLVVASIHWGSNWGYGVSRAMVAFAHRLVDAGVDLVHGHSSHHPRPLEVYRGRLIMYGCGDLVDDYEGIGGYETFRDDLRVLYLVSLDPATGRLAQARLVPLQARRMRLEHASRADAGWLRAELDAHSREFATRVEPGPGGTLRVRPERP